MSFWSRPRNIAMIGGGLLALAFVPNPLNKSTNPFETQGTKNVADRFSAGGGTDVHTPGVATKRGDSADITENQPSSTGLPSDHFKELQADQKTAKPGLLGKTWNEAHYGHGDGK